MRLNAGVPESETAVSMPAARWRPLTRIAFRFFFVYFSLYVLTTQMAHAMWPHPLPRFPTLQGVPPERDVVAWAATHIFRVQNMVMVETGSSDRFYDWIAVACLATIAAAAAVVWSLIDRRRQHDRSLAKWFRVFIRFALGASMINYGFWKIFAMQMSFPQLTRLVEPYGNFSPMGVLWYSIGASPAYERFLGSVETLGGILLFIPQTTLLGAAICLAATIQVFASNMTYDVPVKLFSFHLVAMAVFLLAPDVRRLSRVFFGASAPASSEPPLARGRTALSALLAAQVIFGGWLVWSDAVGNYHNWRSSGPTAPKPPLWGIWNVETMKIDGHTRAPLIDDYGRWRRVIFEGARGVTFQRMDDTTVAYGAKVDAAARSIVLTKSGDPTGTASFAFEQPAPDRLTLDGRMDGQRVSMQLRLVDRDTFLLVSRTFNWIQERPFNK